ncbi:MAG: Gfo/Idh/MocA family oxidoreductase [Chloroflexi bacterium]|nr:Gfo/Idh/MocA family oxidoreductase [Chloroflexota bacterium]
MHKVRIGLVGAGGISRAHINGYLKCPEKAIICAVADIRKEYAEATAAQVGGAEVYGDWRELLEKADVDAVDICLPHDLHAPVAVAAAERGKHILVEKVMARTLEECDAMIAAAERARVKLMVCHDRRYHTVFARIKEIVDSGAIGRLLCLRLDHNQDVNMAARMDGVGGWAFFRERLGGGAILSCLVHQFDLIRWYAGDVAQVGAMTLTLPDRMEGETVGVVPLRFRSGALGDTVINWFIRSRSLTPENPAGSLWGELVWLSGTDGNLHNFGGIHILRHGAQPQRFEHVPVEVVPGHVGAVAHFADCIREDRDPLTNGREGRAALEVALAAYRSEGTGRFIDLPLEVERPV